MTGNDEIIFTGEHRDFRLGVRFDLSGKTPGEAAAALAYVSAAIEPHAFRFSGIDAAAIDKLAAPSGSGLGAVRAFFESNPSGALRGKLLACVPEPALYPAAESCLINRLLAKAGVPFKVAPSPSVKPGDEKIGDFIGFIGKYGQWMAIKKLGLEKVQDYEVSGILAGINHTAVNKAFDFSGVEKNDALVAEVAAGKRKSFGNMVQCLGGLEGKLTGGAGDAYVVCKALEALGCKPYASPEMLTEAHPDIKPPRTRGRKPKG